MAAAWPVVEGDFLVGDRDGSVAICVLTSSELMEPLARVPGVAIAGSLQTANLGIERVVANVTGNPRIRFLVVGGRESKLFRPGQSLLALHAQGLDRAGRIVGAEGYQPVLASTEAASVELFREQVEVVDLIGEVGAGPLAERAAAASHLGLPAYRSRGRGGRPRAAGFKQI